MMNDGVGGFTEVVALIVAVGMNRNRMMTSIGNGGRVVNTGIGWMMRLSIVMNLLVGIECITVHGVGGFTEVVALIVAVGMNRNRMMTSIGNGEERKERMLVNDKRRLWRMRLLFTWEVTGRIDDVNVHLEYGGRNDNVMNDKT
ncbi:hypothetical protein KSF78_0008805 [Schistosoma japonicum]|nr:hypothetical protein KSF78_0008805 [Schistosoma japonicum]KAH8858111.1 hypothetical protein KSF78_0008805 [Schistosoma japonicum]